MSFQASSRAKPAISITRGDHARLTRLVDSLPEGPVTEELAPELDRARLIADDNSGPSRVRIGSTLSYSTDTGETRTVTLVLPGEADIALGKVSILTPIGVALIGLSAGQSIDWTARDGRKHRLTVDHVGDAAPETGAAA